MQKFLSEEEKAALKEQHRSERDRRICDRIKATLLYDEGWSYENIAHALLLTDESVRRHIQDFRSQQKLKPENGGSSGKLNSEQTQTLISHLEQHTYLYVKDIVAYTIATFGISYTIAGMTCWLKNHRFSYKKPAIVPGKANREAQLQWIQKYEVMHQTLGSHETICFIDGVHPTHNTHLAYGWIRKGHRKEIPSNTGRQRINLSGAIDIDSKQVHIREDETLCASSTIAFLEQLQSAYPDKQKIHVFCDNARYYKNKAVTQYLTTAKIELHFLPPYSPNLNPIERLWKLLKERVLYNKYHEKYKDFRNAVLGFLQQLSSATGEIAQTLERRITDNFRAVG